MADDQFSEEEKSAGGDNPIHEGTVLANRFEIRRELGVGSVGICFAAFDRNREQEICLKVIRPALLQDPNTRKIFLNSSKIACDLRHPEIVNVYDVHRENGLFFLSMELLKGKTLRQEMEERKTAGRGFELAEVKTLAESVGRALEYAHPTTLHYSLNPEAIWITDKGKFKVTDFGLSRGLTRRQTTMTSVTTGTAYYLPPELIDEEKELDARGDQYALAVVLYEMLIGEPVAGMSRSLREIRSDVPEGVSNAIIRALSPNREDRFESIVEFIDDLVAGFDPGYFHRNVRLLAVCASVMVFIAISAGIMRTENSASRWVKNRLQSSGTEMLRQKAESERKTAYASRASLEGEWFGLLAQLQDSQKRMDVAKESFTRNLPTKQFSGSLNLHARESDWRDLRPRILDMFYGFNETNMILPDLAIQTLPEKLAEHASGLHDLQEPLLRLVIAFANHVFEREPIREANRKMETAEYHHRQERFADAADVFSEANKLFLERSRVARHARDSVSLLDKAIHLKLECFAMSRKHSPVDSKRLKSSLDRMTRTYSQVAQGEFLSVIPELEMIIAEWNSQLKDITQAAEKKAVTTQLKWLKFFEGSRVPLLKHLGAPDRLVDEGSNLLQASSWMQAHEKFEKASEIYEGWVKEMEDLPKPNRLAWINSLGLPFVPLNERVKMSIWETRVMDFDVFVDTPPPFESSHHWRTLELEGNFEQGPTHPVVWIHQADANTFCRWLTKVETESGMITNAVYRIPTDMEWSLAVGLGNELGNEPSERSGGFSEVFPWPGGLHPRGGIGSKSGNYLYVSQSWYGDSERYPYTAPVGKFEPNSKGIYDLGGNVWEWCADHYDSMKPELGFVIRGGSWAVGSTERMRSSFRTSHNTFNADIGFRIVLEQLDGDSMGESVE